MRTYLLGLVICLTNLLANAQIKMIASYDYKSPSIEDLYLLNELKSLIEDQYGLSVQLIHNPDIYNDKYIYVRPSFTWTRWIDADFWGNPIVKIKYERLLIEVTYFPINGDPVTDRYHIGGFTIKKKEGEIKKKLKDIKFNFPIT